MAERYPLSWPQGWKRTPVRADAHFGKTDTRFDIQTGSHRYSGKRRLSISDAIGRVADELVRIEVREETVIISTNLRTNIQGIPRGDWGEPRDPGVAVYWQRGGKKECMAIDRYTRVADNLAAIAATLEALRAIKRHGGGEILDRAFQGFAALPAAIVTQRPWRDVLGFPELTTPTAEIVKSHFRDRVKKHHPDVGGTDEKFRELTAAMEDALRELAG